MEIPAHAKGLSRVHKKLQGISQFILGQNVIFIVFIHGFWQ